MPFRNALTITAPLTVRELGDLEELTSITKLLSKVELNDIKPSDLIDISTALINILDAL